ncbi:MAG: hypothetical protein OZSIB_2255 [Candidatus Ozemobacter sibiricus]|uniref:Uncharacterized protein n=1 Tax=Candidatus Ozemobacter sibiricus TaxID=2268124 RepID=A0A367ZTL1_9BACT|nr:MAG: hypothetical protein OZSIB_2255 [Candidatus Ozemobacter sibiricus]
MNDKINAIREVLRVIPELKTRFGVKRNPQENDPLLFVGVTDSAAIKEIAPLVETFFGKPYKPPGETAFLMNLFDHFVKEVGGVRREQTLFRKEISKGLNLFCAFWPWASDPTKTSVRIGLLCAEEDEEKALTPSVKDAFR